MSGYVSASSALADVLGMLEAEQEDEDEEDLKDLIGEMELEEAEASAFRDAIAELPAVLEAAREAKAAAKKAAKKKVAKQAPFNGLLDWVRANVSDEEAAAIERARGDTTDGLRAQLALKDAELQKARSRIEVLEGVSGEITAL